MMALMLRRCIVIVRHVSAHLKQHDKRSFLIEKIGNITLHVDGYRFLSRSHVSKAFQIGVREARR